MSGRPPGARRALAVAFGLAGVLALLALDLSGGDGRGGAPIVGEFVRGALHPALDYQSPDELPPGAPAFLAGVGRAVVATLAFAAASLALALCLALPLALLASSSFWRRDPGARSARSLAGRGVQGAVRVLLAGLRSVHELLWCVLFLAALGLSPGTGVVAIALPFAGTLARLFADMLDEVPAEAALGIRATGASALEVLCVGVLPRALPDMAAYAFYRLECAVRSSAVLGFFGFETLGYGLKLAFENQHYREVWTYLYALVALVLMLEAWSAALRRRFVA